ncbi:hypothetical protein [Sapientia aquatica]|uniref:Uncharacterized protein n=1 Tax=Sapientia aquatica TaxID=1549640 RepID=A0A4R5W3K0_9BURK|nr:hypothetical protein [Sapientia aquatica]TDK66008.1 hypothetical protein E2I14_10470 [Sapientia aquatica]
MEVDKAALEKLVSAAIACASVVYSQGMFDLSEQLAFESAEEALKPFGGMPWTPAMIEADTWTKVDGESIAASDADSIGL